MKRVYPHNNDIKEVLNGCSDRIVNDGLNFLIPRWKNIAKNADFGDGSIVDEYLNDMDTRCIIDRVLSLLPEPKRSEIAFEIAQCDEEYISKTFEVKDCLWGQVIQ